MTAPRIPKSAVEASLDNVEELEFLDSGGQGDAWRAVVDGQEQVVKVIVAAAEPARVPLEVASLKAIGSEFVMGYLGSGTVEHQGQTYPIICGEFINGGTLRSALETRSFDLAEITKCGIASAKGIREIHQAGLIHRDIKPPNIGLRDGKVDRAVILDLGLVRDLVGKTITVYPRLVGTVPYMAPEQVREERAVKRSDIFALGVVLFEAVAGQHPYFLSDTEELSIEEFSGRLESSKWPDWSLIGSQPAREVLQQIMAFEPFDRPLTTKTIELLEGLLP